MLDENMMIIRTSGEEECHALLYALERLGDKLTPIRLLASGVSRRRLNRLVAMYGLVGCVRCSVDTGACNNNMRQISVGYGDGNEDVQCGIPQKSISGLDPFDIERRTRNTLLARTQAQMGENILTSESGYAKI